MANLKQGKYADQVKRFVAMKKIELNKDNTRDISPAFKRLFDCKKKIVIPIAGYGGHQRGYFHGKTFR